MGYLEDLDNAYKENKPWGIDPPLTDGIYVVKVNEAVVETSQKKGIRIFKLKTTVTGGPNEYCGCPLTIPFFLQENSIFKLREAMEAMGVSIKPSVLIQNPAIWARFKGIELRVRLETDGQYQNKIIEFRIQRGQSGPGVPPAAAQQAAAPQEAPIHLPPQAQPAQVAEEDIPF